MPLALRPAPALATTLVVAVSLVACADEAEVVDMLGAGGDPDAAQWEYMVAPGGLAPDYTLLVLTFDEADRVASVSWGQS